MNINRIARTMVDVEPSADLEARIGRRLDEAQPGRTAAWWMWRVGAPLAAAAALVLAMVQGPESRVQGPESRVQGPESRVQSPESRVQSPESRVQSPESRVVMTSQLPKIPTSQLSAEELAWMGRRIPALDEVDTLQMDRLQLDSIQPQPLAITPLTITPVGTEGAGIERNDDR